MQGLPGAGGVQSWIKIQLGREFRIRKSQRTGQKRMKHL